MDVVDFAYQALKMDVVDFAYQIIEMANTIANQDEEIYQLKKQLKKVKKELLENKTSK